MSSVAPISGATVSPIITPPRGIARTMTLLATSLVASLIYRDSSANLLPASIRSTNTILKKYLPEESVVSCFFDQHISQLIFRWFCSSSSSFILFQSLTSSCLLSFSVCLIYNFQLQNTYRKSAFSFLAGAGYFIL
jgi:hypothetical protein